MESLHLGVSLVDFGLDFLPDSFFLQDEELLAVPEPTDPKRKRGRPPKPAGTKAPRKTQQGEIRYQSNPEKESPSCSGPVASGLSHGSATLHNPWRAQTHAASWRGN